VRDTAQCGAPTTRSPRLAGLALARCLRAGCVSTNASRGGEVQRIFSPTMMLAELIVPDLGAKGSNPLACSSRFPNLMFSMRRWRREPQVSWGFAAVAWGLENATPPRIALWRCQILRSSGVGRFTRQASSH
jgi:hypothetical protein